MRTPTELEMRRRPPVPDPHNELPDDWWTDHLTDQAAEAIGDLFKLRELVRRYVAQ